MMKPMRNLMRLVRLIGWFMVVGLCCPRSGLSLPLTPQEAEKPPRFRGCCQFGYDLGVEIQGVPIPFYLGNIFGPDEVGTHSYSGDEWQQKGGWLATLSDIGESVNEKFGIIYTVGGGFIDMAHIKDYADWTAYLFSRLVALEGREGRIGIPLNGGAVTLLIREIELDGGDLERVCLDMAQRISFETSVWHEIATWYGYASFSFFPEWASAFSPEDCYSDLLGTYVGRGAILSRLEYNKAVDVEIGRVLAELGALDPAETRRAFNRVEGDWWDSTKRIPDKDLVKKHHLGYGSDEVEPWLVPDFSGVIEGHPEILKKVLSIPTVDFRGEELSSLYEFIGEVNPEELSEFFPFPVPGSTVLSVGDFGKIMDAIRSEIDSTRKMQ